MKHCSLVARLTAAWVLGFAALAFAKANKIDRVVWDTPKPRFGIVTTGKAYADTMEALDELGIDAHIAAQIGLRVYKVGMPWPLEPDAPATQRDSSLSRFSLRLSSDAAALSKMVPIYPP